MTVAYLPTLGTISVPNTDLPFANYTGAVIPPGTVVKCDAANVPGTVLGGILPTTDDTFAIGITVDNFQINGQGRVRLSGAYWAVATAAIAYGADVMAATGGQVTTRAAGKRAIGWAFGAASGAGIPVLIWLVPANNSLS